MLHVGGLCWLPAEDEQNTQIPYLHCKDRGALSLHDYHMSSEAWLQHLAISRGKACLRVLKHVLTWWGCQSRLFAGLLSRLHAVCTQALAMPGLPMPRSQSDPCDLSLVGAL